MIAPATMNTATISVVARARSQPLKAVRRRLVGSGARRYSTSGNHTSRTVSTTTIATATAVSPTPASAVAITCTAARNVSDGPKTMTPTTNAVLGAAGDRVEDDRPAGAEDRVCSRRHSLRPVADVPGRGAGDCHG